MSSLSSPRVIYSEKLVAWFIFLAFFALYAGLAWIVSGGNTWWVIDFVDLQNVFHGDDAYRFFLSRSAWVNPDLYTYSFVLPGQLLLDGVVTWTVQGDLFLARCFHAALGAGALAFVYLSGIELKIQRSIMLCAVLIMALLPRYALMSLSFYGEVWLGFFICLSLWLYLKERFLTMALVASWMPLFRPEGIFFLVPLCLQMLWKRRFRELFILLLPGSIYFFYLVFSLPSLADYHYWRVELRKILSKVNFQTSLGDTLQLYSWLLLGPAAAALLLPLVRRTGFFLVGGAIWLAALQFSIHQGLAGFENRYIYTLVPLVVMLWAFFFSYVVDALACFGRLIDTRMVGGIFVFIVAFYVVANHILKTDNLDQEIKQNGYLSLLEKVTQGRWDELYGYYPKETLEGRRRLVGIVETLLEQDKDIAKLAIGSATTFYDLDPYKLPGEVTVGFLTNSYMDFYSLLDGQTFIQHPGGPMYTYLDYGEPDFQEGEKRVLVAHTMPLVNYPYTWISGGNELYLFSYLESWAPKTNLSERSSITPRVVE